MGEAPGDTVTIMQANLYNLAIAYGSPTVIWSFLFKKQEDAQKAFDALTNASTEWIEFKDDFGTNAKIKRSLLGASLLESMNDLKEGQIERMLQQARIQAAANTRAQTDPALKTLAMMGGMANNGMHLRS